MGKAILSAAVLVLCGALARAAPVSDAQPGIDAFNRAVIDSTKRMDNAASVALWEEDGVSLLPATEPIVGKPAIAAFLGRVTAQFPGAHMESFTLECRTIFASAQWASERCVEHQVVKFADSKPPFDGRGTILYILHHGKDGRWRIKTEMWNPAAEAPQAADEKK
jgi:ketosteroid isomerase-like protein